MSGSRTATGRQFDALLRDVRKCRICPLPHGTRPVLQADPKARILIAGQAPGRRVHESGVPFQDPSGDRLRAWMGITSEVFYDASKVAILPMGFCYPGAGRSGDLPPRPECARAWREPLLAALPRVELTLAIGAYAQAYHLGDAQQDERRYAPGAITGRIVFHCRIPRRATTPGYGRIRGSRTTSCPRCGGASRSC